MKLKEFKKNLKTEYQNTFPKKKDPKREFHFQLRYAFLAVFGIIFAALLIQHFWVYSYNEGVDRHNEAIANRVVNLDQCIEFSTINTRKDYDAAVRNYKDMHTYQTKKKSILTSIFTYQPKSCSDATPDLDAPTFAQQPGNSGTMVDENSFQTNIQVEGIDEADIAKCDGSYIYYFHSRNLYVYDIESQKNITSVMDNGIELFIYNHMIISIGNHETKVYEFNQDRLVVKKNISYERYLTSRLIENRLYLAFGSYVKEEIIQFEDCYYDTCSNPNYLYSAYYLDLDLMEDKEAQLLTSNSTVLYASNQAFYFASMNRAYTTISIFSHDLEPRGVINVNGTVLNQFSMDEYEGYFRVVTTDTTKNAEELNAISIFDLSELKKVGYLNQGIGKERQIVKSVRFDKNTCYVVTYENTDPLYEIDCSTPEKPVIVSAYEAPGYSNYLHTFVINDKEYVLGLGYTDSRHSTKISVYEKTEGTEQIGEDFILAFSDYYSKGGYYNESLILDMFQNHKALFIYNAGNHLYLGAMVAFDAYLIFKIDVNAENVVTIYKEIELKSNKANSSRLFLIENKIYLTDRDKVLVENFA
ncbi:MAG: beta-propeller domain-containing protein [Anaeroplasmataceae bacterium]|nr:beta-propeller domain-containing protein [Anaeroplasmataceae bacterium]MDE6414837.1 beta-propeller domain-containing protein [Anaeroplasmataceae bacterium]